VSESDSFINEVSEAVRRERLYGFLRRYGWLIALAVVLIVGGAAVNEWRKARAAARAEAAGDALREALLIADPAERAAALEGVAAAADGLVVVRFAQAGALREAGDAAAAAAVLAGLGEDGAVPEVYRALAALERVMLLGSDLDAGQRRAALEALAQEGAPFRPLALEQRALMWLDAGDTEAALADLEAVLAAPQATEGLRARARQLIIAAGGALAPENTPGDAPAGAEPGPAPASAGGG
jgi:hypothetical protein